MSTRDAVPCPCHPIQVADQARRAGSKKQEVNQTESIIMHILTLISSAPIYTQQLFPAHVIHTAYRPSRYVATLPISILYHVLSNFP